jgi:hypothetical protein
MRLALIVAIAWTAGAHAHISMDVPTPRFDDGQNKWCPCGTAGDGTSGPGNRPNNGCEESAVDDARGETQTSFQPGQKIAVQWRETIGHSGRMRIAFDPDGADQNVFDAHILADVADPDGNEGNMDDGDRWCIEVTLPDEPCDNCTLQLVQVMNGDVDSPVTDVFGTDTYYQCADLVLAASADTDGGACVKGPGNGLGGCGCGAVDGSLPAFAIALLAIARARGRRRCGDRTRAASRVDGAAHTVRAASAPASLVAGENAAQYAMRVAVAFAAGGVAGFGCAGAMMPGNPSPVSSGCFSSAVAK